MSIKLTEAERDGDDFVIDVELPSGVAFKIRVPDFDRAYLWVRRPPQEKNPEFGLNLVTDGHYL